MSSAFAASSHFPGHCYLPILVQMFLQKGTAFKVHISIKWMVGSRNARHKQIGVVYVLPPDYHCFKAADAAPLWVYSIIFIPLSGITRFGLGARNVMGFSSPGLNASHRSPPVSPVWCLYPSAQSTCRLCLLDRDFTGLCSLPPLFFYYVCTFIAILN